jgi:hypothetical protein
MVPPMDWQRYITAAHGYLELGMGQDAWDELDSMPPEDRARREVVLMRLMILQSMERWDKAAEIALGAVRCYPDFPDLYLMGRMRSAGRMTCGQPSCFSSAAAPAGR